MITTVRPTPVARTRISTSVGPGFGTGTWPKLTRPPNSCSSIAFMSHPSKSMTNEPVTNDASASRGAPSATLEDPQRFRHEFGDVQGAEAPRPARILQPLLQHLQTERALGGHHGHPGLQGLAGAQAVDLAARQAGLPGVASPGPAAEAALTTPGHLAERQAGAGGNL